ncbi:MAG: hypothetical protein KF799_07900 [Bdellovibrionales bacterium]|nr:hypothetical protein [Bdellovibrionales bacterium]
MSNSKMFFSTLLILGLSISPATFGNEVQPDSSFMTTCAQALSKGMQFLSSKRHGPVALLFGINRQHQLRPIREHLQSQLDRPLIAWAQFARYGLIVDRPDIMFTDKFLLALERAVQRNSGSEPFIHFVLDGIDLKEVWSSYQYHFTSREIQLLFEHPHYLKYTRWYLNGAEVDGAALLKPFSARESKK